MSKKLCKTCHWWFDDNSERRPCIFHIGMRGKETAKIEYGGNKTFRTSADFGCTEWERNGATGDHGTTDCSTADRSRYELIVGPIEPDLDGFTAEDRKEWLEDAGWRSVQIRWIE